MLADDLVGLVSLRLLGAFVPGADIAAFVHQEYGVILDAVNQQLEAFQFADGILMFYLQRFQCVAMLCVCHGSSDLCALPQLFTNYTSVMNTLLQEFLQHGLAVVARLVRPQSGSTVAMP